MNKEKTPTPQTQARVQRKGGGDSFFGKSTSKPFFSAAPQLKVMPLQEKEDAIIKEARNTEVDSSLQMATDGGNAEGDNGENNATPDTKNKHYIANPVMQRWPDGNPNDGKIPDTQTPAASKDADGPGDGLIRFTVPRWEVKPEDKVTLKKIDWKSNITVAKIPIPDFGTLDLDVGARAGVDFNAGFGPVILKNITISMTKSTAAVLGISLATAIATGSMLPLIAAGATAYIEGFGELEAPAKVKLDISAGLVATAALRALGVKGFEVAELEGDLSAGISAYLEGVARGGTRIILDNGRLKFHGAVALSVGAGMSGNISANISAKLFKIFRAKLGKQWSFDTSILKDWKPIGNLDLNYANGFSDKDKIITIKEETIKSIISFIKKAMEGDKNDAKTDKLPPEETGPDKRTLDEKKEALKKAIEESDKIMDNEETVQGVRQKLFGLKQIYRLTIIDLRRQENGLYLVHAEINPVLDSKEHALKEDTAGWGKDITPDEILKWETEFGKQEALKIYQKYGVDAMRHYKMPFFKLFLNKSMFTAQTRAHVVDGEGISAKQVSGCHDTDKFLARHVNVPVGNSERVVIINSRHEGQYSHYDYKKPGQQPTTKPKFKSTMKSLAANWQRLTNEGTLLMDNQIKLLAFPQYEEGQKQAGGYIMWNGTTWDFWFKGYISSIYPVI